MYKYFIIKEGRKKRVRGKPIVVIVVYMYMCIFLIKCKRERERERCMRSQIYVKCTGEENNLWLAISRHCVPLLSC